MVCPSCKYVVEIWKLKNLTWTRQYMRPFEKVRWPVECARGHRGYIEVVSAAPHLREAYCLASWPERPTQEAADGSIVHLQTCDWRWRSKRGPANRGFFNGRVANDDWVSMGLVLASVGLCSGSATRGDVIRMSGLRPGAVDSALSRGFKHTGTIERSSVTVNMVPTGRGFVYRLTRKGQDVLRWIIQKGKVRFPEGRDVEGVLAGARKNPRGLRFIRREG